MALTPLVMCMTILVVVLLMALVFLMRKRKTPTDYYNMFLIGFMWTAIGIPLEMFPFSAIGVILMLIGLVHRKDWKQHKHKEWKQLGKREKMLAIAMTAVLAALIIAGLLSGILLAR